MAVGWNDSFDDLDVQSDAAFHQMFIDAWAERIDVVFGGFLETPISVSSGDDIQSVVAFTGGTSNNVFALQSLAVRTYYNWVDPDLDPEGMFADMADPNDPVDMDKLVYQSLGDFFSAAGINSAHGFERRRPREIATALAFLDTQENPCVAGQRAYLLDFDTFPTGCKGLYVCNGPGNWTRDLTPRARPDELSNYNNPPNAIKDDGYTIHRRDDETVVVNTGRAQAGDYMGSWLWRQIRDAYNAMRMTVCAVSFGFESVTGAHDGPTDGEGADGGVSDQPDYASAVAIAHAQWPNGVGYFNQFATGGALPYCYSSGGWNRDSNTYSVAYTRLEGQLGTLDRQPGNVPLHSRKARFYCAVGNIWDQLGGVFDANGDGFTEDRYHLVGTVTSGAEIINSPIIGSLTIPNDAAAPVPDPEQYSVTTYRGYGSRNGARFATLQWDGDGGFQYRGP